MQAAFALWICAFAYLNCLGWLLSAGHQLNPAGYAVALLPGLAALVVWSKKTPGRAGRPGNRLKFLRRFRRPFPLLFLIVAALIFLGGLLQAPSNYDALTYRLPRMLNWLAAGHWFWIPTINDRMNYSGVAWEWTAMPLLVLTRSDRGLFLINALGFLLMPGLLLSVFRQLGVARRVAWTWMWLLPLTYGFATQAGGIGNDLTGALCGLLSIHFGLRARRSSRAGDVWLALLAAALMTGVKISNLPLALPCLVALWPALGHLRRHLAGTALVAVIAMLVSGVPIMVLNQVHTGSWNGDPGDQYKMQIKNPAAGVLGNSLLLAEQSLMPPALPGAGQLSAWLVQRLPDSLKTGFPRLLQNKLNEIPGEENAGLGLGITLPLLIVLVVSVCRFRLPGSLAKVSRVLPPVALAAWLALLVFMAKIGSEAGPRLLLPYYPLILIPVLLLPAQRELLRHRAWRIFLGLMAMSVLPVLIFSVSRPLWPAQLISNQLALAHPGNKTLQRLASTYATYARRNDVLEPIRSVLPDSAREIGFLAGSNDADYSLWRPFGKRRVIYPRHDIRAFLQNPDLEWVVVKQDIWPEVSPVALETWAAAHHATIVATRPIVELVSWGPENWCVLHFEKP